MICEHAGALWEKRSERREFTTKHSREIRAVDSLLKEEESFTIVCSSQIHCPSFFYQGKPSEIKIPWILTRPPNDRQQAIMQEAEVLSTEPICNPLRTAEDTQDAPQM